MTSETDETSQLEPVEYLAVNGEEGQRQIAVIHQPAKGFSDKKSADIGKGSMPATHLLWLSGLRSDMAGTKALALAEYAARNDLAITRFDYAGHGRSPGRFEDYCLSDWLADSEAVFAHYCRGPTILVGSSMGGWIALLLAIKYAHARMRSEITENQQPNKLAQNVVGLMLIAPAPDFTEELMWKGGLTADMKRQIEEEGQYLQPSEYDSPLPITKKLIKDGRRLCILGEMIRTYCPVSVLHGADDRDVPLSHVLKLIAQLSFEEVGLRLIPGGDHRLSRDADLAEMMHLVDLLRQRAGTTN